MIDDMTLVTALCTQAWVALAADRRITSTTKTGTLQWQADAETKVAIIDGESLAAFTGAVPIVDGVRGFENWIISATASYTGGSLAEHLRRDLGVRWQTEPDLRGQRFMLILTGFRLRGPRLEPFLTQISNSMDRDGETNSWSPVGEFRIQGMLPAGVSNVISTRGLWLDDRELSPHFDVIDQRPMNDSIREGMYQRLYEFYTEVAAGSNGAVGANFIVATLPREGFGDIGVRGSRVTRGEPSTRITSAYLGPDSTNRDSYQAALVATGRHPEQLSFHKNRVSVGEPGPGTVVPMTSESPGNY